MGFEAAPDFWLEYQRFVEQYFIGFTYATKCHMQKFTEKQLENQAQTLMRELLLPYKTFLTSEIESQLVLGVGVGSSHIEWFIYLPAEPAKDGKMLVRIEIDRVSRKVKSEVFKDNFQIAFEVITV